MLVVHENRGLNPHIEDIARRLALDNFIAFAPDALAPLGGYPGDEDQARQLFPKLDQAKTREDFVAAYGFLKGLADSTGKVGVVGFCYGGGIANMLATRLPDLAAAVPFYGNQASAEDAAKIKSPLLVHYAENDQRINAGWPAYEAALKAANVPHTMHMYPGTQHGFNNDTTPRYDEAAAKLAWQRTIEFFNKHLRVSARQTPATCRRFRSSGRGRRCSRLCASPTHRTCTSGEPCSHRSSRSWLHEALRRAGREDGRVEAADLEARDVGAAPPLNDGGAAPLRHRRWGPCRPRARASSKATRRSR